MVIPEGKRVEPAESAGIAVEEIEEAEEAESEERVEVEKKPDAVHEEAREVFLGRWSAP